MERSSIRDHYDLLISLLKAERQQSEQEAALRQAKFDLRQAKAAAGTENTTGGLTP